MIEYLVALFVLLECAGMVTLLPAVCLAFFGEPGGVTAGYVAMVWLVAGAAGVRVAERFGVHGLFTPGLWVASVVLAVGVTAAVVLFARRRVGHLLS